MQPEFGSIIWNMLYEPLTPEVQAVIVADVKRIIEYDPRLSIDDVLINELEQGVQIQIDLTFLPNNLSDRLVINFDNNSKNLTVAS
jgi:phage baseplate assembly protein W